MSRSRTYATVPFVLLASALACLAALAVIALQGLEYYALEPTARPDHVSHPALRSSGRIGLSLGIVGTGLMLLNLTYLVRKRLVGRAWLGPLRSWMAFHVVTGIVGPSMVILHSGFRCTSPLATLALVAMLVVLVTGVVGRFIYAVVPRSLEGRELEIGEVRRQLTETLAGLRDLGVDDTLVQLPPEGHPEERGLLASLLDVFVEAYRIRREYQRLRRSVLRRPELRARATEILPLARILCRRRHWYARYSQLRRVMGAWRFFHRWLAIVLFAMVLFHVLLALRFGDL